MEGENIPERLNAPVLMLDMHENRHAEDIRQVLGLGDEEPVTVTDMRQVLGLNDGGAVISFQIQFLHYAVRVNQEGATVAKLHSTTTEIMGFILVDEENLFVLEKNGIVTGIRLGDGSLIRRYEMKDMNGDMYGGIVEGECLLLLDCGGGGGLNFPENADGAVFRYRPLIDQKELVLNGLNSPLNLTKSSNDEGLKYIVIEYWEGVTVYNSNWDRLIKVGSYGIVEKRLFPVGCAIVTPEKTLLVTDLDNCCVREYSLQGEEISDVISRKDGILKPLNMSLSGNKLWISYNDKQSNVKCFQLYRGNHM